MALGRSITAARVGRETLRNPLWLLLLLVFGYYLGAQAGAATALVAQQSVLWPASAVLLAGMLFTPVQYWWQLLLAALPVHLLVQAGHGVPPMLALAGYGGDCTEALIGGAGLYLLGEARPGFATLHKAAAFLFICVLVAPALASFLHCALALAFLPEAGFWQPWRARFLAHAIAILMVVPLLAGGDLRRVGRALSARWPRRIEAAVLAGAVLCLARLLGWEGENRGAHWHMAGAALVLAWAAVRFGAPAACAALLALVTATLPLAMLGAGPFAGEPAMSTLAVQLSVAGLGPPLLLLGAAARERAALIQDRPQLRMPFFHASSIAMAVSDVAGGPIRDVNDRWQDLFGLSRAEALGKTLHELRLAGHGELPLDRHAAWLPERELVMRHRDGSALHIVVSGGRIDCGPRHCFITVLRDMTQQRRREQELRQQREQLAYLTRVVLLGELSGGLAHELNQPLAAILANIQAARRCLSAHPGLLPEILDDIDGAGKHAVGVIHRLRLLFLQGQPKCQPVDLNAVVRDALALTRASLAELEVTLAVKLDPEAGKVHGDPVQLQQVLLNLIVNGSEAMQGLPAPARRLELATRRDGGEVRLLVADAGPGIAPEVLARIFEPFFTTKPHGLGFGLPVSHAIIAAHGGRLEAANGEAGGCVFSISLPGGAEENHA